MSPVPEKFTSAASDASHDERVVRRREAPGASGNERSSSGEAVEGGTDVPREAAIDDAVEMTFPASDPPAWMPPGGPHPDAVDPDPMERGP